MSFLTPFFLLGLAALAVPVLIHLIQRERKRIVEFPSLMFVRKIPYQSVRRRRIRYWLLLVTRALALALVVLAFARPFLRRPALASGAGGGAREVVILLDRSYSMAYGDRWTRAQAAAREAVRGLGAGDRASLILFGRGASLDVRSTAERPRLAAAIDAARAGAEITRFGPALKLAQSVLQDSRLPRREAILISDFQKAGWDRGQDVRFPDGATLKPLAIGDAGTSNVTVSGVTFQRAPFAGRERVTVAAGLTNHGDRGVSDLEAALEIDGRAIQTTRVAVPPRASASVTFAPFTLAEPYTRGSVRIAADALPRDDVFHFVLSPSDPVGVAIVTRPEAPRETTLYLARALAIGTAPSFRVDFVSPDRLTGLGLLGTGTGLPGRSSDSAGASGAAPAPGWRDRPGVIILNDVALPRAAHDRLTRFMDAGGGVIAIAGDAASWSNEAPLPAAVRGAIDRTSGGGATLGVLDYSHPIFELFRAPRSGDFSAARVFRYRALEAAAGAQVLARFDDGGAALVERASGRGRALVWASPFDILWSDLPLKPVFLPFVHRLVAHAAGYREPAPWLTVGQVLDVQSRDRLVATPSGRPLVPADDRSTLVELSEQGFYEVRARGAREARPHTVAVNIDVTESDLTGLDPQELVAAVTGRAGGGSPAAAADTEPATPLEQERRQALWRYLLLAAILLLAAETVMSNRLSRAAR